MSDLISKSKLLTTLEKEIGKAMGEDRPDDFLFGLVYAMEIIEKEEGSNESRGSNRFYD